MFKHVSIITVLLLIVLPTTAQDNPTTNLSYGSVVEDSITNERFEVFYTVKGEAEAVVVFEMIAIEDDSELNSPELALYDDDGNLLMDTFSHFGFEQARLVLRLPYTGTYELVATRRDGRAGDSFGDYRLRYIRPPMMQPGETINDAALNNKVINYYAVTVDQDFSVFYEFSNGELDPEIEAYRVDDGELINVGTLRGRELQRGSIGMDGSTADVFLFTVGDSPFASYFDDRVERVDYRLRMVIVE